MQQPFDGQVITAVLGFGCLIIFLLIVIFGVIAILKQLNERERIRQLPKVYKEGKLLVKRRHNSDGRLLDLFFDGIGLGRKDVDKDFPVETRSERTVKRVHYPRKN